MTRVTDTVLIDACERIAARAKANGNGTAPADQQQPLKLDKSNPLIEACSRLAVEMRAGANKEG